MVICTTNCFDINDLPMNILRAISNFAITVPSSQTSNGIHIFDRSLKMFRISVISLSEFKSPNVCFPHAGYIWTVRAKRQLHKPPGFCRDHCSRFIGVAI